MATFSMDPPGCGETLFTGLTWNDERDFRSAVALAVDFLLETGRVRSDAIGIFSSPTRSSRDRQKSTLVGPDRAFDKNAQGRALNQEARENA